MPGGTEQAGTFAEGAVGPHSHNAYTMMLNSNPGTSTTVLRPTGTSGNTEGTDQVFEEGSGIGIENVPQHIWTPLCIYLGLTA